MPGTDCKNSTANMFKRKVIFLQRKEWDHLQFISQKPGIPDNAKFLAVDWHHPDGSDPLFLTNENDRQNRFICEV